MKASGTWPITAKTAFKTQGSAVSLTSLLASMETASQQTGSVTAITIAMITLMSWKECVVRNRGFD